MQSAAIPTFLDDPMIGAGGDQQGDCANEQPEPNPVHVTGLRRKLLEPVAEDATKAEAEQDLCPENQYPGLIERYLDLLRQLHS